MRTDGTSARTVEMRSCGPMRIAAMYLCKTCDVPFAEPLVIKYSEPRPDCFYERFKQLLCPVCGQGYFDEIKEDEDERTH